MKWAPDLVSYGWHETYNHIVCYDHVFYKHTANNQKNIRQQPMIDKASNQHFIGIHKFNDSQFSEGISCRLSVIHTSNYSIIFFLLYHTFLVWKTKFLVHSPQSRCLLYVLYKIPHAQANFLLAQLKMHLHWWAGEH